MRRTPTDDTNAPPTGQPKLIHVETRLLDLPPTPLDRQPTPARGLVDRSVIGRVALMRLPVVTPKSASGRRDVLANASTVLWHRSQIFVPISAGRRIWCLEVPIEDGEREQWQAIDNWVATDLFGWNSKRRSAEIRRGVRGTKLRSEKLVRPLREELSCLLKGKAK